MLCLNLGCGKACRKSTKNKYWVNIDLFEGQKELYFDLKKQGFDVVQGNVVNLMNCYKNVDEIHAYHLIEHLSQKDAIRGLTEWHNALKKGGKLVLELPDLRMACKRFLKDEKWVVSIFGADRLPYYKHLWGYSRKSIKKLLEEVGFRDIKIGDGIDYHNKEKIQRSDNFIRIEGIK